MKQDLSADGQRKRVERIELLTLLTLSFLLADVTSTSVVWIFKFWRIFKRYIRHRGDKRVMNTKMKVGGLTPHVKETKKLGLRYWRLVGWLEGREGREGEGSLL